jgi:P27 family predicted phage terminase small subunit
MKGRKPKPVTRHIAEGDPSKFGKKKLEERLDRQVQPNQGIPECPKHLSGTARDAWTFWAAELRQMNLDSRPDAMMLEGACVNYARALQADRLVETGGLVIDEPIVDEDEGEVIATRKRTNPAVAVSNAAWRQVRAFCSEFGFSPVSRTRLTIEKPDTSTQDLMEMLTRPREPRRAPSVQ